MNICERQCACLLHHAPVCVSPPSPTVPPSYKVSPADLTEQQVIRYELDQELMPLVLANSQYSLERGRETLHEYDLAKIQQQVLTRFLQGRPIITLQVSRGRRGSTPLHSTPRQADNAVPLCNTRPC